MSRTVNWQDRNTCILWGDGAGAVVLRREEGERGLLSLHLHTDGTRRNSLPLPGGGSRTTAICKRAWTDWHTIKMEGQQDFNVAVRCFTDVCHEALQHTGVPVEDVALLVPHQANLRIIQAVAYRLGLTLERVALTIHKYGSMSSARVLITLDEAWREGRIHPGDLVLMATFGGGLTWASTLVRW